MFSSALGALLVSAFSASAFKNTSPFILFSTSEILLSSPQIISATSLGSTLLKELGKCPSDIYVIVSQPGVNALDYSGQHSTPHLDRWLSGEDKDIRTSFTASDVLGEIEVGALVRTLENKCGAGTLAVDASTGLFDIVDDMRPRVIRMDFPSLPGGEARSVASRTNDLFLSNLINILPSSKYTVVYTTRPLADHPSPIAAETSTYEMDRTNSPFSHIELKRYASIEEQASPDNDTLPKGPLFERYQFFTPGLFMGLFVSSILISILYVGISGIASLQVSYASFDRENGPAAQKQKQQQ